jgi:hypothetical protein
MLDRVTAMLIKDLGRSRVIFLALTRGQEFVVSIFYNGIMTICGHGSMGMRCLRHEIGIRINNEHLCQAFESTKNMPRNMVNR